MPGRERRGTTKRGGRPWRDPRDVLHGILWVLRIGAPWADLPGRYPPYQTCHRRFQKWEREGVLDRILRSLAEHLRDVGKLDLTEAYIDGSHAGAKRGALLLGELDAAKRPRSWQWRTESGLPVAIGIASGQRHETQLVLDTLRARFVKPLPERLIGALGLRQRQTRRRIGRPRRRDDRAASPQAATQDAGWTPSAPLPPPVARRATLLVAVELPPARHTLRTPRRQLPRPGQARLHCHPAPTDLTTAP